MANLAKTPRQSRYQSGVHYDLAEFIAAYNLTPPEARDLFARFGPSKRELDLLMKAKRAWEDGKKFRQ
jgi:hypothetical protein